MTQRRSVLRKQGSTPGSGVEISYRVGGSSPRTVVFLHGLAGYGGEWNRTAEALESTFTTVTIDQRGHGASTREPADTSRDAFVGDVVAVLDDIECAAPVALVGQSMGAHTALLTAARHPERVERLVMVEGDIGGGGDAAAKELRTALARWPACFASYEQVRDFFGGDTARGLAWAQGYERRPDGWWPRFERGVMESVMAPIFATERWEDWKSLEAPTLLVQAQHSAIDTGRVDAMCRMRPSTRRVVIPHACHDLHLEQPDSWINELWNFLTTTQVP